MEINSIIDTIKRSIVTGTPADVKITEKSFLAELLGKDNDESNAVHKPQNILFFPHFNSDKRFPITHYIFQCLWFIVTLFISLLYFLSSKTLQMLTGRKRDLRASARFNAVLFIACITSYIVILAFSVTFLLKSVLFFDPDNRINSQGAIMMKQPLGIEQYMYLFNTAILWDNTGIELLENDRVEVSVSGSFYGKISDLSEKATSNDTLRYKWNKSTANSKKTAVDSLCIYKDACFGSLLFQICPEKNSLSYSSRDSETLTEKNEDGHKTKKNEMIQFESKNSQKFSFTAHMDGILFLAVNDIYLDGSTIKAISKDDSAKKLLRLDTIGKLDSLKKVAKGNEDMWFKDNIGEILLNVSVYRDAAADCSSMLVPNAFSKIYRELENAPGNSPVRPLVTLLIALLFIVTDFRLGKTLQKNKDKKKAKAQTPQEDNQE